MNNADSPLNPDGICFVAKPTKTQRGIEDATQTEADDKAVDLLRN